MAPICVSAFRLIWVRRFPASAIYAPMVLAAGIVRNRSGISFVLFLGPIRSLEGRLAMKILIAVVGAVLLLGTAQGVVAEKPATAPVALEKKLHGVWKGLSACQGDLTVRAD